MHIIIFFFMNIIVFVSAFLLNYKVFKCAGFIDSLLSLFILYFALIVSSELLLGIAGALYLRNVILLNLAILLVILLVSGNKRYYFAFVNFKAAAAKILANKVVLFFIALILGFGLVKFFINLVNPPFGWDDLNYHFTFPVEWIKHGNLNNPITISDDPSPSYYPINASLFFLWLMLALKNVFLADLGQAPFFFLAFLAIYSISKKIGLCKEPAFYAAGLFLITPNIFKQLKIAYVDMMVAALFLVSLNYLFLLSKQFSRRNALIFSMSLGLVLGTKTLALPYGLILFFPFFYYCFKNNNRYYLFMISIFVIVALGGFSYIRNFFDTGNPLFPLDFKIFGKTVFKGVIDNSIYRAHFKLQDYSLAKLLFREGLGAQTLIFILPSVFLVLPVMLIKNKRALSLNFIYFLILPFLIYLAYRYIIPLANTRYLYPLLGVGIIIGFYTAGILNFSRRIVNILVVICALSSIPELARRQELVASVALTAVFLFLLPYLLKYIQENIMLRKPLFIPLFLISIILALIFLEQDYIKNEYPRYIKMEKYSGFWPDAIRAWDWLNRNTSGNNIAYAGRPVPFPLYGSSFKNDVYYVSVNKVEPAKLHYFPDSRYSWGYDFLSLHKNLEVKGNYRGSADYSIWLNNIQKQNTDYLFIYSLHQTEEIIFPMEDEWAASSHLNFRPVFINKTVHIYRILK